MATRGSSCVTGQHVDARGRGRRRPARSHHRHAAARPTWPTTRASFGPRPRSGLTDKSSGPSATDAATMTDYSLAFTAQCAATADTAVGASCGASTTADTLIPGAVAGGKRAIWELDRVKVLDGGPTAWPRRRRATRCSRPRACSPLRGCRSRAAARRVSAAGRCLHAQGRSASARCARSRRSAACRRSARRDQPVQHAAERLHDVEALRLADDGLLDLQLARAVAQVDRPDLERRRRSAPASEQPVLVEGRAGDAARRDGVRRAAITGFSSGPSGAAFAAVISSMS